jgi:hypothetical protein
MVMEIIFQGSQSSEDAAESLISMLKLFKERYGIENFRQMHLSVTLLDSNGDDVELVDSDTSEAFRVFEVYREGCAPDIKPRTNLKLVVDNTK